MSKKTALYLKKGDRENIKKIKDLTGIQTRSGTVRLALNHYKNHLQKIKNAGDLFFLASQHLGKQIGEDVSQKVYEVIQKLPAEVTSGRSPSGVVAAVFYILQSEGLAYTQKEISEMTDTTGVTLRKLKRKIEEVKK